MVKFQKKSYTINSIKFLITVSIERYDNFNKFKFNLLQRIYISPKSHGFSAFTKNRTGEQTVTISLSRQQISSIIYELLWHPEK